MAAELHIVPRPGDEYTINPELKVALVGFASSSRNQAPWDDKTWEIWGMNSLYAMIPRFNRWFEIHPKEYLRQDLQRAELLQAGIDHYTWLTEQPGPDGICPKTECECKHGKPHAYTPIYMQDHYDEIPASVRWPRREINEWSKRVLGKEVEPDYFTSTPGQMVATAAFLGAGEIALYGIDLLEQEEYAYQRPGCEYWIGVARGLGIHVHIPAASVMCKANYVYGFIEPPTNEKQAKPMIDYLAMKDRWLEVEGQKAVAQVNRVQGNREAAAYVLGEYEKAAKAALEKDGPEAKIDSAEFLKWLVEDLGKRLKMAEVQVQQGIEALNKISGSRETYVSMKAMFGAWARGDRLEGMSLPQEGGAPLLTEASSAAEP